MFMSENSKVRITVGISGTGGGFKKFLDPKLNLRTDISGASRPIKQAELDKARDVGVNFVEIPVALDGLAVMVNPKNTWCNDLTTAELKKIWEPGSSIQNWKDVRAGFPDKPLRLFGPGTDSGTFDFFTEVINGKEKASRSDYSASENDNALVQGIAGDEGSLGYFGFAYYEANEKKLKLLGIDNGDGKPVKPSSEVVRAGGYKPLARPLFLYLNLESLKRPEVRAFLDYVLDNSVKIVEHPKVQYVAFPEELYKLAKRRMDTGKTGTAVLGVHGAANLVEVYRKDQ
jgi:phosphate transport system substrate-binding protein